MFAEQRTGGVVWGSEDNGIGPRECFFNRLGGLRIGLFEIADTVDDVVPLGRKRSAKGLAHIAGTYHRNSHDLAPLKRRLSVCEGASSWAPTRFNRSREKVRSS